jgi:E-phenylitaconyl-CoA hydratase
VSVDLDIVGGVATVTLNRVEKHNAIDPDMRAHLGEIWRRLRDDHTVRACVITGAGSRAFCVGSDLSAQTAEESFAATHYAHNTTGHLLEGMDFEFPVIAAVNGYAIGGGMEIALACDIRVASLNAEFGLSEVRVGSIPGAGGTQRLPRTIGTSLAMQMLLTGDRIDAQRAYTSGLVSEIVPLDQLMHRATSIAHRIASNAPLSVRAVKRLASQGLDMPLEGALEMERVAFGLIRGTADRAEGRTAFREKREPNYEGR